MWSDPLEASLTDYEERYSLTGSLVPLVIAWLTLAVSAVVGGVVVLTRERASLGDLVGTPGFWGFIAIPILAVVVFGAPVSAGWSR